MKLTDIKITRYSDGKFLVDIVDSASEFEAWIGHESYGVSEFMFGVPKKSDNRPEMTFESFLDMVQDNLQKYEKSFATAYID